MEITNAVLQGGNSPQPRGKGLIAAMEVEFKQNWSSPSHTVK